MNTWADRILAAFPEDVARFWIAADPDAVLLDEALLGELRARSFDLIVFEDSVAFRAAYEERFRQFWDRSEHAAAKALVLHLRARDTTALPADYLRAGRQVNLSLADLFPRLSYAVLRQLDPVHLGTLFDAHERHATQRLGDAASKEFVLLHIHRISPHLIARPAEFWRELLRLHFRGDGLPAVLAAHMAQILSDRKQLDGLPIAELFESKAVMLRMVQGDWSRHLAKLGLTGSRVGEAQSTLGYIPEIPFDHPDVQVYVDSMFLDGSLHPLVVKGTISQLPEWAKVGVVPDPLAMRDLVAHGVKILAADVPHAGASHRDWGQWAQRFGELLSRFYSLDTTRAESVRVQVTELQRQSSNALVSWCRAHYGDMSSLPASKAPAMVHHVPQFLGMRRDAGDAKVALVVFDGLALDQWAVMRERLVQRASKLTFDEGTSFAWMPTLTSVSRQAIFSGMRPREFANSIETTSTEPQQWSRFWQDLGLKATEVAYRKGLKRVDHLKDIAGILGNPAIKALGMVVDTVDEIVHGAVLGKRGVAKQIEDWCDTGFVDRLFNMLLDHGFHVYLTADHGNVDAVGIGRPSQGVAAETRGERVRTYRNPITLSETAAAWPDTIELGVPGLPAGFYALYAGHGAAFVPSGDHVVVHGGVSVEEMIVPFVKVSRSL